MGKIILTASQLAGCYETLNYYWQFSVYTLSWTWQHWWFLYDKCLSHLEAHDQGHSFCMLIIQCAHIRFGVSIRLQTLTSLTCQGSSCGTLSLLEVACHSGTHIRSKLFLSFVLASRNLLSGCQLPAGFGWYLSSGLVANNGCFLGTQFFAGCYC